MTTNYTSTIDNRLELDIVPVNDLSKCEHMDDEWVKINWKLTTENSADRVHLFRVNIVAVEFGYDVINEENFEPEDKEEKYKLELDESWEVEINYDNWRPGITELQPMSASINTHHKTLSVSF